MHLPRQVEETTLATGAINEPEEKESLQRVLIPSESPYLWQRTLLKMGIEPKCPFHVR